jgi:hypothetical protein
MERGGDEMEEFEAVIKANGFEVIETMRIKDGFPPPLILMITTQMNSING